MQMYPIFIPYHSDGNYAPMPLGVARWFGVVLTLGTLWLLALIVNVNARWDSKLDKISMKIVTVSGVSAGLTIGYGIFWFAWQLITGAIR